MALGAQTDRGGGVSLYKKTCQPPIRCTPISQAKKRLLADISSSTLFEVMYISVLLTQVGLPL